MKVKDLFGLKRNSQAVDEKVRSINEAGKSKSTSRDPSATRVKIVTPKIGSGAAGQMESSPVSLEEIGQAYHSDSYIRRAVDKITGLMFKSGWSFVSLNQEALDYVQTRFRLIEESTGISTEQLLREIGNNYVLYGNSPIVKTRGQENLGGLTVSGYYGGDPISGLFPVSPENFEVQRDEFGNVESYSVNGGTGSGIEFSEEDFSHLTYHKPTGRAYGVPYINNVIDDVLILRQIEENIARLVYRNIFPLQTYTVGSLVAGYEATDEEIEEVQEMIQNAPLDSIIVMPERHKLETVSSNNAGLDAYNYLRYFRQRVFTGLGVSESTMGIGDSSNKSTSDNQSSDLVDLVKDFQQNFADEIQNLLINEILFEGGYDPTLNKEDRVVFQFTEIEQSAKIARENHELQKFMSNVQDLDETRNKMGYEPITDLSRFYFKITANSDTQIDPSGTVDNKDQPENQSGKALNPNKDTMKDSFSSTNVKENTNRLLTKKDETVNLTTDDVISLKKEEKIKTSWLKIKSDIFNLPTESIRNKQLIESISFQYLDSSLFQTEKEKSLFAKQITENLLFSIHNLSKDSLSRERLETCFYQYEQAVLACYEDFSLKNKEGGSE